MGLVDVNWRPAARDLRIFGVVMIVGFAVVTGGLYARGHHAAAWVAAAYGAISGLAGLTGTAIALPFYWLWMGIAFVLGNIVSRLLFSVVFYGLFTPMGLVMRLIGRDPLQLKRPRTRTYWRRVRPAGDREYYQRQS